MTVSREPSGIAREPEGFVIAWLATVTAAEITQKDQVPQNVSCTT
jgi:hypothetical protein